MLNTEKLNRIGRLGDVRQRLGADSPEDESQDVRIEKMTNTDMIAKSVGWSLGDDNWWIDSKSDFDRLEEIDKESEINEIN
jgi:hypothetical protein